ncbi:hypothetical protein ACOSQ3_015953 [Xanthoceras sorbifolium]
MTMRVGNTLYLLVKWVPQSNLRISSGIVLKTQQNRCRNPRFRSLLYSVRKCNVVVVITVLLLSPPPSKRTQCMFCGGEMPQYEIQDLHVVETLPQMDALSEACLYADI